MISSLSWHSSNKFDFAHLTNSEIRVKKSSRRLSSFYYFQFNFQFKSLFYFLLLKNIYS